MRLTRLTASLVTAGLLGLSPVALSAPANAATETLATTTAVTTYSTLPITYGDEITLTSKVAGADGNSAYKGTVTLMVSTPSAPAWTPVTASETTYEAFKVKPATNAAYKIVYSGYTAVNQYEDTYLPSESAPFAVSVARKAVFETPGLLLVGKITPDFGKKKVVLKRKKGKKYVAWKKVKTNKKGQFRVKAPNKSGFRFSVTIPSDASFTGYTGFYQVY